MKEGTSASSTLTPPRKSIPRLQCSVRTEEVLVVAFCNPWTHRVSRTGLRVVFGELQPPRESHSSPAMKHGKGLNAECSPTGGQLSSSVAQSSLGLEPADTRFSRVASRYQVGCPVACQTPCLAFLSCKASLSLSL